VDNNQKAFFELLRAGLWEKEVRLSPYKDIDFSEVYRIAEEQSVIGLVAASFEHVSDVKVPQQWALQFAGQTIQLEQRNKAMNAFIAKLIGKLRNGGDVYTLLVKGQGIAQCYERPLWRVCGDVDLFLSEENYKKAQAILIPIAHNVEEENPFNRHLAMTIDNWEVELHGTLRSQLGKRIDRVIDEVQEDVFFGGNVRSWDNNGVQVFLPSTNNDTIFIFTHILQHYFGGGIGLRQICDWCRLLYTYRDSLNHKMLELRLRKMGLLPHWKAFAVLAVDTLGMPVEAMPLYSDREIWHKKGDRILSLILESGNFGHGRDQSYKKKYPKFIEYAISFWVFTRYGIRQFKIFPSDAMRGWSRTIRLGIKAKLNSE
jgi:hypothetical protein